MFEIEVRVYLHTETFWIKIHVLNFDEGSVKIQNLKKLFSLGPPTLISYFLVL